MTNIIVQAQFCRAMSQIEETSQSHKKPPKMANRSQLTFTLYSAVLIVQNGESFFEMNWLVWWVVIVGTIGVVIALQLDDNGSEEIEWPNVGQHFLTKMQDSTMANTTYGSPLIRSVEWTAHMCRTNTKWNGMVASFLRSSYKTRNRQSDMWSSEFQFLYFIVFRTQN